MTTAYEPPTEWRNRYHTSFHLSSQRLTLSNSFCVRPKQGYVSLNLDQLPLLHMTSDEARAWAAEITQTADRADKVADEEAAGHEAEQALRKSEGYDGHFDRIPDTKGLPPGCWFGDDTGLYVHGITDAIKDDFLDLFKCAGCRPRLIEWSGDAGQLFLRVGDCSDWFSEWACDGRRGIEGYLSWIGDPRFPSDTSLRHLIECSWIGAVEDAPTEQIIDVLVEGHPHLDRGWLRRILPRLREQEVTA